MNRITMHLSRRQVIAASTILFAGCASSSSSESIESETTTERRQTTNSKKCYPQPYIETPADRTEYAVGLYEDGYDVLESAQENLGVIMGPDGIMLKENTGVDANYIQGLVVERRDEGDTVISLIVRTTDQSALYDMRNDRFYDAIEKLRELQEYLDNRINGTTHFDPPWEECEQFIDQCDVKNQDLFVKPVRNGLAATRHLKSAASLFERECKSYLDNDASFEESVSEAEDLQEKAISKLYSAADKYPRTPESLENEALVYRSD
ncbi:hypothetical protein [Haloarcula sebkhae]|uniref:Uncharacterized protein n=2 Tax=Haloarcula sebkhae TaxID=932660 RepID=A0ACC6VNI5_9EURY|nr:hypothetical protein [Haloarcula sebkhae]GGK82817.1 hypothetical protein GCM10009067_38810 [Haloarcula sebkhae]